MSILFNYVGSLLSKRCLPYWTGCFQTLSDTYAAALAEVGDTPGKAASTVRAYASLLVNALDDSYQDSAEEIELYQVGIVGRWSWSCLSR